MLMRWHGVQGSLKGTGVVVSTFLSAGLCMFLHIGISALV